MRSHLLISVEQLPTIREDTEVKAQCERLAAVTHMDSGLEDYVKSIQTLAQPSSLTDHLQVGQSRSQRRTRSRLRSSLKVCENKVLAEVQDSKCCASLVPLQTNADPLAWLYRQSGKENKDNQEPSAGAHGTLTHRIRSANPLNLHKTTDTPKRPQLSKSQSLQNVLERRNRQSRLPKKCYSAGCSNKGPAGRLRKPLLPVIYEL